MFALRIFIARPAIAEFQLVEDACLFEQFHRAVDRGDRDAAVDLSGAGQQFLGIRMVVAVVNHLRDDPALTCHAQAHGLAPFDDRVAHRFALRPSDHVPNILARPDATAIEPCRLTFARARPMWGSSEAFCRVSSISAKSHKGPLGR